MAPLDAGRADGRAVVARARASATALVATVLAATAASSLLPSVRSLDVLVGPAAAIGAIGPAIGYRRYLLARDRRGSYLRAVVSALAVTGVAALFGAAVHGVTGELLPLIGPFMHVLLAAVIWPADERLSAFSGAPSGPGKS
ncbi:MAG TPA: hypothetical protein VD788_11585 [Candidatus Polarisedimenticolaceae bacterium]|nr:hypothetical protein [Candidatus Polarisedimenticolaceae bacterium]